ncbi:MAG: site-2 protease family protein [Firmicutes bacterium]|nr:site-2 protease family protein [Bacillota bacterium]
MGLVLKLFVALPGILLALTIHEFSHAYSAYLMGDPTAKYEGRLTLNPVKHIDPIGGLLLLLTTLFGGGMTFGWAKPVPINPYNFRNAQDGTLITSLAGPVSNLIAAALCGLLFRLGIIPLHPTEENLFIQILYLFVFIFLQVNIGLAIFNLIPIPPLDGSKVLYGLLPTELAYKYSVFERKYAFFLPLIFVILIASNMLNFILFPFYSFFFKLFTGIPLF